MANINVMDVYNHEKLDEKDKDLLVSISVSYIINLVNYYNKRCKYGMQITFDDLVGRIKTKEL